MLYLCIKDHIVNFLVNHNLINSSQHKLRKRETTPDKKFCFWKKLLSGSLRGLEIKLRKM